MGVAYESVLIDIHGSKPQKEAWYLRLNPNGTVPTLQDGDVIVTESEDIVTHVGKGSQLVPDVNTKYGQEVAKWRKTINAVSIETITMGTVFNPELSCSGFKAPKSVLNREKVKASFQAQLDECKQLMEKNPDLRKEYEAKINKLQWRLQTYGDKSKITPALDNLESLFDQLEQQLTKMAAGALENLSLR
nr:hypothetical protein BaRGS_033965 [Batillaria attramentaria]